jgi:P4 family phage/plasmid primase-like protien
MVEDALADELAASPGTYTRELPDAYGQQRGAYSGGARVLARNGVLELDTGQLALNTPLWFSLTRIEADHCHGADPYADSQWLRMLRTQWPDDPGAITCLQQWFGYVISGRTDLQKWMLIIGPSGSGKSIIADVLGALAGLVKATKLDDLNSQFGLQTLYETGAQLAVLSDIRFGTRDSSTAVENLLAVTGEDVVSVARKYKATVSAKLRVRFHASANEIPRWSDNSSALQRRALLLETSRGFRGTEDEDSGLKQRILANELGLVLRWAVEGLALLNASGGMFTQTLRAEELAQEVNDKAAPVRRFIAECCIVGTAKAHMHRNCDCDYVDSGRLFAVWEKWAKTNGHMPGSHVSFRSALKALYLDPIKPGQRAEGGVRIVWGIKSAETIYTDRGQIGTPMTRTVSTMTSGDPMHGGGSLN